VREYKNHRHISYSYQLSGNKGGVSAGRSRQSKGFDQLGSSPAVNSRKDEPASLDQLDAQAEHSQPSKGVGEGMIWVESEVQVTIDDNKMAAKSALHDA
jgi:hypothetical protein